MSFFSNASVKGCLKRSVLTPKIAMARHLGTHFSFSLEECLANCHARMVDDHHVSDMIFSETESKKPTVAV